METHTNVPDMQIGTHWDWEAYSPLARLPIVFPSPPYTPAWPMSHTISLPVQHTTPPVCLQLISPLKPQWVSQTHTETWRVPCLTPGPRWSLVWRPVCVCLASNGPFKCRIFTADRAILGDSTHWGLNYALAPLSWRKLSLLSSHNATLTGNELVWLGPRLPFSALHVLWSSGRRTYDC